MRIKNIRHIGLVVKDLEESLKFYMSLGFTHHSFRKEDSDFIDAISGTTNIQLTTTRLILPNNDMIELLNYGKQITKKTRTLFENGIAHFAMTVEDIYSIYNFLIEKNIKFISEPKKSADDKAIVVFCISPEGTFIELVEVL